MCLCETKYQGGVSNLPEKVSRDMGYRSDSIAVSRDMERTLPSLCPSTKHQSAHVKKESLVASCRW